MDRYTRIRVLGRGHFGVAFVVGTNSNGVQLVAKEVFLSQLVTDEDREIVLREADRLRKLHHPNIVRYVEHFEEHGAVYIITEYADNGDLYSEIESNKRQGAAPMPENLVVHYIRQLAYALHHLHSQRMIHRDVKPMNVFLTSSGDVKLGDVGLSIVLPDGNSHASTFCGTAAYSAPEMLQGQGYDGKIDVWALGVTLYQLMTYGLPFNGSSYEMNKRIVEMPYPAVPTVLPYSDVLRNVLDQCLRKEPGDRPDSAGVLELLRSVHSLPRAPPPLPEHDHMMTAQRQQHETALTAHEHALAAQRSHYEGELTAQRQQQLRTSQKLFARWRYEGQLTANNASNTKTH